MLPFTLHTRLRWPALLPRHFPHFLCEVHQETTLGQSLSGAHPNVSQPFNLRSIKWDFVPRPWDDARPSPSSRSFPSPIAVFFTQRVCANWALVNSVLLHRRVYHSSLTPWRRRSSTPWTRSRSMTMSTRRYVLSVILKNAIILDILANNTTAEGGRDQGRQG